MAGDIRQRIKLHELTFSYDRVKHNLAVARFVSTFTTPPLPAPPPLLLLTYFRHDYLTTHPIVQHRSHLPYRTWISVSSTLIHCTCPSARFSSSCYPFTAPYLTPITASTDCVCYRCCSVSLHPFAMSLSKLNTLWDDYLEQLDKNPLVTKVRPTGRGLPILFTAGQCHASVS